MKLYKKLLFMTVTFLIILTSTSITAFAQENISVVVFGKPITLKSQPIIENNKILLPLEEIATILNIDVKLDDSKEIITLEKEGVINKLVINNFKLYKTTHGITEEIMMDLAPRIVNGIILVPIQYIAKNFDICVTWNKENNVLFVGTYDVNAINKEDGWKILKNHEYDGLYDIYFKLKIDGTIVSSQIETVSLASENMQDVITFTLNNGEKETLTRKQWYDLFWNFGGSSIGKDVLYKRYGNFYHRWFGLYLDPNPAQVAEKYIDLVYVPKTDIITPILKPDSKVFYEWNTKSDLEALGLILDDSQLKITVDSKKIGNGILSFNVVGNIKIKNKATGAIMKQFNFNDILDRSNSTGDGYYKLIKDGLTILTDGTASNDNMKVSGADLLKLGIIK